MRSVLALAVLLAPFAVSTSQTACGEAKAPPTGCDISVPSTRTDVVAGKRYCLAGQVFTAETKFEDAKRRLVGCEADIAIGATILRCSGAELAFGGPILRLGTVQKLPAKTSVPCDRTVTDRTQIVDGYRYCLAGQMFTSETSLADAQLRLPGCTQHIEDQETILMCRGAVLTFRHPVQRLSWMQTR